MNTEKKKAAGVLVKCLPTNKVLLLLRSDICTYPKTWSLISGGIDGDEEIFDGLRREVGEEIGIDPNYIIYRYQNEESQKDIDFYYYEGYVGKEFRPRINEEHLDYVWCDLDSLPTPLFPGLLEKIKNIL
jgi:8-oxo-dGTP pyrophosphatase MutT (NUDIX family)